ncbi:Uncharacterised protein [Vibrio cholerae]|nr:Uncharacterised protein [Vibrio cholerae]
MRLLNHLCRSKVTAHALMRRGSKGQCVAADQRHIVPDNPSDYR